MRQSGVAILIFAGLAATAVALRLVVGGVESWADVWQLRAQRAAGGAVVGAALALGGVLLQCLMRNPLASTDLLGMAAGGGLGVMVATLLVLSVGGAGAAVGLGVAGGGAAALVGSLAALAVTYVCTQRRGFIDPVWLVLVGVVVGVVAGALATVAQQFMPLNVRELSGRWMRGAISDELDWVQIAVSAAVVTAVGVVAALSGRRMDAASLPDDEAMSVGVPLRRLRIFLFVGSGALAAVSVVLAGPVGFVGLVCPHVARLASGPAHRALVVNASLCGVAMVVMSDVLVRAVELPGGRLPLNALTAVVGGPALVMMLRGMARGARGAC